MAGEELTALIGAYEPGPGGLRALLPLAGATLVEHQARRATEAGVGHVLLLIDEMPPALAAAVSRLKQDGIRVELAQGVDVAAEALLGQRVLLIADACLPDLDLLGALARSPVPTLAVLADVPDYSRYERIDADARWAGAAMIDGPRVAETAAMLGSWDPISTLLRRAVQEDAGRLAADAAPPLLLVDDESVDRAARGIIAATRAPARDWTDHLYTPLEELALPFLLERSVDASLLAAGAAALALIGSLSAWFGASWVGLLGLLLAGPITAAAVRLARVRARSVHHAGLLARIREVSACLAVMGLARTLAAGSGQWGWWLVGLLPIASMLALAATSRLLRQSPQLWLGSVDGLVWTMLPFALAGRWAWGLVAVAAYAGLSFAAVLRLAIRDNEIE